MFNKYEAECNKQKFQKCLAFVAYGSASLRRFFGAVLSDAKASGMDLATRYTLLRNNASIMKIVFSFFETGFQSIIQLCALLILNKWEKSIFKSFIEKCFEPSFSSRIL